MGKTSKIVSVVAVVIIVSAACVVLLNADGEEDDRNEADPVEPDVSQKKLTIRNELVVGDWVTVTVPTKTDQFVMRFTVESIDGDIANLRIECDENNKYYQNLSHLTKMTKVWKTLDRISETEGGLCPVVMDDSVGIPMFIKNWESMKPSVIEMIGKETLINDGRAKVSVKEGTCVAACGLRTCIIYDSSVSISESEFQQYEGSEDFTYEIITQSAIIDEDLGILWGVVAFGPLRIDSSVYEYL